MHKKSFTHPRRFTFFTNWTFLLFGFWAALGVVLSAVHLQVGTPFPPPPPPLDLFEMRSWFCCAQCGLFSALDKYMRGTCRTVRPEHE